MYNGNPAHPGIDRTKEFNMSKVAVVYWTGSGNTEAMAAAMAEGAETKGATVEQILAADFSLSAAEEYDAYAFGCPAMGAEELEDSEFRPMWDEVKGSLGDKKVVLFGSYGWGNGEWMDAWKEDAEEAGVNVIDSLIINEQPEGDGIATCQALGSHLA